MGPLSNVYLFLQSYVSGLFLHVFFCYLILLFDMTLGPSADAGGRGPFIRTALSLL